MEKKQINVTQTSMPPMQEYFDEIAPLWDSKWLTHYGVKYQELQKELCDYLTVNHIFSFTNGHLALESAIYSLGLTGEVITTPFTFISTTQAIVRNGLTPVFCDIDPKTFTIDVNKIEDLITEKTSAIIPVHVYGSTCDVEAIETIAKKHNLKVIYDAAHAFGNRVNGKGIGEYGDASMFSFHATKVFNTIEGGCIVYSDDELTDKLHMHQYYGMSSAEECPTIGCNAKMTEFQAAMGICNLRYIDSEIAKRKVAVKRYLERLGGVEGITTWHEQEGVQHNYAYFPVLFDEEKFGISRDEVVEKLAAENIFARKYFYPLTSEYSCYDGKFEIQETPIAKKYSRQVLTLPLYADLTVEDVDRICDVILNK